MIARIVTTGIVLLLGIGAEWSTGRLSFGMFFLLIAMFVWHGWAEIAAAYRYLGDSQELIRPPSGIDEPKVERDIVMFRLGPLMIKKPRLK